MVQKTKCLSMFDIWEHGHPSNGDTNNWNKAAMIILQCHYKSHPKYGERERSNNWDSTLTVIQKTNINAPHDIHCKTRHQQSERRERTNDCQWLRMMNRWTSSSIASKWSISMVMLSRWYILEIRLYSFVFWAIWFTDKMDTKSHHKSTQNNTTQLNFGPADGR